jgi:hypothetical protein
MSSKLAVEMHRTVALDSTAVEEGASSKYLDVTMQYFPSCKTNTDEDKDRDWFKMLVDANPTIDNLSEVVNAAARSMISQVNPSEVNMTVRLSNDVDKHGFCSKTVYFSWSDGK